MGIHKSGLASSWDGDVGMFGEELCQRDQQCHLPVLSGHLGAIHLPNPPLDRLIQQSSGQWAIQRPIISARPNGSVKLGQKVGKCRRIV